MWCDVAFVDLEGDAETVDPVHWVPWSHALRPFETPFLPTIVAWSASRLVSEQRIENDPPNPV
jgi:hypothetical protein